MWTATLGRSVTGLLTSSKARDLHTRIEQEMPQLTGAGCKSSLDPCCAARPRHSATARRRHRHCCNWWRWCEAIGQSSGIHLQHVSSTVLSCHGRQLLVCIAMWLCAQPAAAEPTCTATAGWRPRDRERPRMPIATELAGSSLLIQVCQQIRQCRLVVGPRKHVGTTGRRLPAQLAATCTHVPCRLADSSLL